jgi:hypothetical protein
MEAGIVATLVLERELVSGRSCYFVFAARSLTCAVQLVLEERETTTAMADTGVLGTVDLCSSCLFLCQGLEGKRRN